MFRPHQTPLLAGKGWNDRHHINFSWDAVLTGKSQHVDTLYYHASDACNLLHNLIKSQYIMFADCVIWIMG